MYPEFRDNTRRLRADPCFAHAMGFGRRTAMGRILPASPPFAP